MVTRAYVNYALASPRTIWRGAFLLVLGRRGVAQVVEAVRDERQREEVRAWRASHSPVRKASSAARELVIVGLEHLLAALVVVLRRGVARRRGAAARLEPCVSRTRPRWAYKCPAHRLIVVAQGTLCIWRSGSMRVGQ